MKANSTITVQSDINKKSKRHMFISENSEFKNIHKNKINTTSARRLSDECSNRLNLTDELISEYYSLREPIGHGKYGTVHKGFSKKNPGFIVAIKVIKIRKIKSNFESIIKEIQTLKEVSHPNIVKIFEIFRDDKKLYLVMEYVKGKELFDYIVSKNKLPENDAWVIIEQLIKIVKYLNSLGICHRDLKPENIMINPKTLKIKLLDFGLSSHFSDTKNLVSPVGTPYYVSPEVLRGDYSKECDMWSIGVITYILLTGTPPFQAESMTDIYRQIITHELSFYEEDWSDISPEAKDFVSKLIQPNIKLRLTPDLALNHSWIRDSNSTEVQIDNNMLERLAHSKAPSDLKKEILLILINLSDEHKLKEWNEWFESLDKNGSGMILVEEIIHKLKERGTNWWVTSKLESLVENDSNVRINYFDFLVRVVDVSNDFDEEDIKKAFSLLDTDNKGKITDSAIKKFLQRKGDSWSDLKASIMINQVDENDKHNWTNFKWNSGLNDESDPEFRREEISYNTFKDYILNKKDNSNHDWRKLTRQPTFNFIQLNNQATIDDEIVNTELKACSTYLKNYEMRHSSFKFSVSSTS